LSAVRECLFNIFAATLHIWGYAVVQLVEALRYKSEGRWFDSRGRTMALGSIQPLTEMSTRNISWRVKAAGA
jgi:hypothetical protein